MWATTLLMEVFTERTPMKNPYAKPHLHTGPMSADPVQKNKSRAPRKRVMKNRFQGTRHVPGALKMPRKNAAGYYDHSDGLPY